MPVIFDIDKTIYKKTTVRQFLPAAFLNGTLPLRFFLSLPIYFLKIVVFDTHNSFLQKRIKPLRGLKESAMAATAREVFEKKIRFGLNEVIVERLKKAQKSGEHVIIASSSFLCMIRPIAEYLDVKHVIATEIEFIDGVSSGLLKDVPAFRYGKKERLTSYLKSIGEKYENCVFYSDHSDDIPLLSVVGRPILVNPGKKLARLGRQRKWDILRT